MGKTVIKGFTYCLDCLYLYCMWRELQPQPFCPLGGSASASADILHVSGSNQWRAPVGDQNSYNGALKRR